MRCLPVIVTTALVACLATPTTPAWGEASDKPWNDRPPQLELPTPFPSPWPAGTTFPVLRLDGPVLSARGQVSDVRRARETRRSAHRVDARLDATVLFAKDSAVLRPGARQALAEVVAALRDRPAGTVVVQGFTDDLGSAAHGLELSRRRAQVVREELAGALPRQRVTAEGLGEARPLVPNVDEASRARNRRVEVHWAAR